MQVLHQGGGAGSVISTLHLSLGLARRRAARVIAVSHAVGDALVLRGTPRDKLAVIHNGVVVDRIDVPVSRRAVEEWKSRIGWEPSRRTIGIVARLKDQEVVIQALDRVRQPVRLVLAGVDPASYVGRLSARVPKRHAVVCLPFTADVRPLYELLELALLPSRM